ncbi:hypothetical protein ACWPKO_16715 [Coraliomargarita sp. W4R53]
MKKEIGRKISGSFTLALGVFCMIYLFTTVDSFLEFIFPTGIVCMLIVLLGIKILRGRTEEAD